MTRFLVHLDVLVAPKPDKISRKMCTPTIALLIHVLLHVDSLGALQPDKILRKKRTPTASLL